MKEIVTIEMVFQANLDDRKLDSEVWLAKHRVQLLVNGQKAARKKNAEIRRKRKKFVLLCAKEIKAAMERCGGIEEARKIMAGRILKIVLENNDVSKESKESLLKYTAFTPSEFTENGKRTRPECQFTFDEVAFLFE